MHLNVFNGMSASCVPLVPNVANNTSPVIVTWRFPPSKRPRTMGIQETSFILEVPPICGS